MKCYGRFEADGTPTGFWTDEIFPPQNGSRSSGIPAEAVEITEAQWSDLLAGQPFTRYVDGAVKHLPDPSASPP
jgi:hypothetical protein